MVPSKVIETGARDDVVAAGRRVRLRSIRTDDEPYLGWLTTCEANIGRWRFRGRTPSWEEFLETLWDGVLCQYIIETKTSGRPVGLVVAYQADLERGWVYLAILGDPRCRGLGWPLEGGRLLIEHLFENWPLRKIYIETLEFNARSMASGLAAAGGEPEAVLRDHAFYLGRYWDLYVYSIGRQDWEALDASQ